MHEIEINFAMNTTRTSVAEVYDVYEEPLGNGEKELGLTMKYYPNGTINDYILKRAIKKDHWSQNQMWTFTYDALAALNAAKDLQIPHRDIKPLNIFVDTNGFTPIGDWGESVENIAGTIEAASVHGTPLYLAPECHDARKAILMGKKFDLNWFKADTYSLGKTILNMCRLSESLGDTDE